MKIYALVKKVKNALRHSLRGEVLNLFLRAIQVIGGYWRDCVFFNVVRSIKNTVCEHANKIKRVFFTEADKSFDITENFSGSVLWYDQVERAEFNV